MSNDKKELKPTLTEWLETKEKDRYHHYISVDEILQKIKSGEFRGL